MLAAGDDVPCIILPDARFVKPTIETVATLAHRGGGWRRMTSFYALMGGANLLPSAPRRCTPTPYGGECPLHRCVEKFSKAGELDTHLIRHLFNEERYIDYVITSSDNDNHPVCTHFEAHPIRDIDPKSEPFKTIGHSSHLDTRPPALDPKTQSVVYNDIIANMYAKAAVGTCTKDAIGLG
jgi:hypothetical protein